MQKKRKQKKRKQSFNNEWFYIFVNHKKNTNPKNKKKSELFKKNTYTHKKKRLNDQ